MIFLSFFKKIEDSARHLKKTRDLTLISLLLAIKVTLSFFTVRIGQIIKISFGFLTNGILGYLYGPFIGFVCGALGDIISYFISPMGPYFPGFTLTSALAGFVYGYILYKKEPTITRILTANLIITVFLNLALNTLWISVLYGNAYMAILPPRILKEFILVPIQVPVLYMALKVVKKVKLIEQIGEN